MSEQANAGGHGRRGWQRQGRAKAMTLTLWVSLVQVVTAAVIVFGAVAVSTIADRNSDATTSLGIGIIMAVIAVVLALIGTMITGTLAGEWLFLAAPGYCCLAVVAALASVFVFRFDSVLANVLLLVAVLTAVNLIAGYGNGMHRRWSAVQGGSGRDGLRT